MRFFEYLQKATSEDNGNPSSMRFNITYAHILYSTVIAFGFVWVLICYKDFILEYLVTISALSAGLLGIKGWQKGKEEKTEPKPEEPQP